jgi:hypothetical protein
LQVLEIPAVSLPDPIEEKNIVLAYNGSFYQEVQLSFWPRIVLTTLVRLKEYFPLSDLLSHLTYTEQTFLLWCYINDKIYLSPAL